MTRAYRLIYTVTFSLDGDVSVFARRLAEWGRGCGYTTKWVDVPEGETPADLAARPLVIYKGAHDDAELGVTLLPQIPSVRVSYHVSLDATPEQAHKPAVIVAADIALATNAKLRPLLWDLYGRHVNDGAPASPYLHLETGSFLKPAMPVAATPGPVCEETWN